MDPYTTSQALRLHFEKYGKFSSFERPIDPETGGSLGVVFMKFPTHEQARKCVMKENGRKGGLRSALKKDSDEEEWKVVFDDDSVKLKALMAGYVEKSKRGREEKRKAVGLNASGMASATPTSTVAGNTGTPLSGFSSPAPSRKSASQIPNGSRTAQQRPQEGRPSGLPQKPTQESTSSAPPNAQNDAVTESLRQARAAALQQDDKKKVGSTSTASRGKNVLQTTKYALAPIEPDQGSPMHISRSPSPDPGMRKTVPHAHKSAADREKERLEVTKELARNGHDHLRVQGSVQLVATVSVEDVRDFFQGFDVDKVRSLDFHKLTAFPINSFFLR